MHIHILNWISGFKHLILGTEIQNTLFLYNICIGEFSIIKKKEKELQIQLHKFADNRFVYYLMENLENNVNESQKTVHSLSIFLIGQKVKKKKWCKMVLPSF